MLSGLVDSLKVDSSSFSGVLCYSLGESSVDDRVEEISEESEPFSLLDLAITISVEAVEELLDLVLLSLLVGLLWETHALGGELHDLGSVDFTVTVDIELAESLLSLGESLLSGVGDSLTVCV